MQRGLTTVDALTIKRRKIEEYFKKQLAKKHIYESQITVKEIIVATNNNVTERFGEFNNSLHSLAEDHATLLTRINKTIEQLANYAKKIHYHDNYTKKNSSYIVKNNCRQRIVRLITSEFFFYPDKANGPLTENIFSLLIASLEQLAITLPENLHLILASFPVIIEKNAIFNITVSIHCGRIPLITTFAKFFAFYNDPCYLTYYYPWANMGSNIHSFISLTEKYLYFLIEADFREMKKLIFTIFNLFNYLPPEYYKLNNEANILHNELLKLCLNNLMNLPEVFASAKKYFTMLTNLCCYYDTKFSEQIKKGLFIVSDENRALVNYKTSIFEPVEICIEHHFNKATIQIADEIKSKKTDFIPCQALPTVLVSNTTCKRNETSTKDNRITQADPLKMPFLKTSFSLALSFNCKNNQIYVYNRYLKVSFFKLPLLKKITNHNNKVINKKAALYIA